MLRELVEIEDLSQTKHGSATSSVSILLGIFRAVQKAEDVIDSDITHVYVSFGYRFDIFHLPINFFTRF